MLRSITTPAPRIAPSDAAITALFVALAVAFMIAVVDDEGASWAAVPLFTLLAVPMLWRRRAPLAALAGLTAAVGLHVALFGTLTRCGLFIPVDALLLFAAGARLAPLASVLAWGVGLGAVILMLGFDASATLQDAGVFAGAIVSAAWLAGALVRVIAARSAVRTISPAAARS